MGRPDPNVGYRIPPTRIDKKKPHCTQLRIESNRSSASFSVFRSSFSRKLYTVNSALQVKPLFFIFWFPGKLQRVNETTTNEKKFQLKKSKTLDFVMPF